MTTAKSNPVLTVQPYLFFDGRCEEAIEFYRSTLGAEAAMLSRYKDSPDPNMCAPGTEDKVMDASLQIGDATLKITAGIAGIIKIESRFDRILDPKGKILCAAGVSDHAHIVGNDLREMLAR